MTARFPIVTDIHGARTLQGMLRGTTVPEGAPQDLARDTRSSVVVGPIDIQPTKDPDGTRLAAPLQTVGGGAWSKVESTALPVQRISNGNRIALPVGRFGLCVQDIAFWAINVGALGAPTGPFLTSKTIGTAAVLRKTALNGDFEVTDQRLQFVNRDPRLILLDGQPIALGYVSGDLTVLWALCDNSTGELGLEADPGGPEEGPGGGG